MEGCPIAYVSGADIVVLSCLIRSKCSTRLEDLNNGCVIFHVKSTVYLYHIQVQNFLSFSILSLSMKLENITMYNNVH